jgi:molybdopterin synthase sulfur carrier subunit
MTIKLVAFGIAKDILQNSSIDFAIAEEATVATLKSELCAQYPEFQRLKSFAIAVNEEYQTDDFVINSSDEVVIIPPVSGG